MKAKTDDLVTLRGELLRNGADAFLKEVRVLRDRGVFTPRKAETLARLILKLPLFRDVEDPLKDEEYALTLEEGSAAVLKLRTSGIDGNGRSGRREP